MPGWQDMLNNGRRRSQNVQREGEGKRGSLTWLLPKKRREDLPLLPPPSSARFGSSAVSIWRENPCRAEKYNKKERTLLPSALFIPLS